MQLMSKVNTKIPSSMQDTYRGSYKHSLRDGYGRLESVDGSIYTGYFSNNLRHGHGICQYNDSSKYEGEWKFDKYDGPGAFTTAHGNILSGTFVDGKIVGKATIQFNTGAVYNGDVENGIPNGYGTCEFIDGSHYDGIWLDGEMHDRGKQVIGEEIYDGDFRASLRCGNGILTSKIGKFEGSFVADRKNGYGVFKYSNGDIFQGNYVKDQRHGAGKLICSDNTTFEGTWINDRRSGEGKLRLSNREIIGNYKDDAMDENNVKIIFDDGSVYIGQSAKGRPNCIGKLIYPDQSSFEGVFAFGEKISGVSVDSLGQKTELKRDGNVQRVSCKMHSGYYEGEVNEGMRHGRGIFTTKDTYYEGQFNLDQYHGAGQLHTPEFVYVGQFSNGKLNGLGNMRRRDGSVLEGTWEDGEFQGNGIQLTNAWNLAEKNTFRKDTGIREGSIIPTSTQTIQRINLKIEEGKRSRMSSTAVYMMGSALSSLSTSK